MAESGQAYRSNYLLLASLLQLGLQAALPLDGQPEVHQLDGAGVLGEEQKILRLEVAVAYLDAVQVGDSLGHLPEDGPRLLLVEASFLVEAVEQFAALAETALVEAYSQTR